MVYSVNFRCCFAGGGKKCTKIYINAVCNAHELFVWRFFCCWRGFWKFLLVVATMSVMAVYRCISFGKILSYFCSIPATVHLIWKNASNIEILFFILVQSTGKCCSIRYWKFPEIQTGIFGPMESAPYISLGNMTSIFVLITLLPFFTFMDYEFYPDARILFLELRKRSFNLPFN